jgi:2-keto-4-pentenoate hydratase/2-oxohepta-3-ene-1,7-dioic acid hydratase in catechol pathway
MSAWLRFTRAGDAGNVVGSVIGIAEFGTLEADGVHVHRGDLFLGAEATGEVLPLAQISWAPPCVPSKFIGLWNNFRAAAVKQGNAIPSEPLYFIKAPNSYLAHGASIRPSRHYAGRVVYEGELGIVIGQEARDLDVERARQSIFGYTCVNDVTAVDVFERDPGFVQWTRAKSFDGFGPFGPVIATGLDPATLTVRTLVNGRERQNYRTDDMIFTPAEIVSRLSRELTLLPGDLIACGTSLGIGVLKPGSTVEVHIEGIGTLQNRFEAALDPAALG